MVYGTSYSKIGNVGCELIAIYNSLSIDFNISKIRKNKFIIAYLF